MRKIAKVAILSLITPMMVTLTSCDDLCVERAVFFLHGPCKAAGERGHAVRFDARDPESPPDEERSG